ncbi:hypothetical protein B0H17DRAFT_1130907 [Mycena rosella]|uniref:Uncharacterized protein n=1 Tax=Mycena rosella TaxID=1033263 RepID=A0AAD7DS78_MYCRO|nr:hypothetical protein B0H17DRAFT_1130907 [Mycena rosella]
MLVFVDRERYIQHYATNRPIERARHTARYPDSRGHNLPDRHHHVCQPLSAPLGPGRLRERPQWDAVHARDTRSEGCEVRGDVSLNAAGMPDEQVVLQEEDSEGGEGALRDFVRICAPHQPINLSVDAAVHRNGLMPVLSIPNFQAGDVSPVSKSE